MSSLCKYLVMLSLVACGGAVENGTGAPDVYADAGPVGESPPVYPTVSPRPIKPTPPDAMAPLNFCPALGVACVADYSICSMNCPNVIYTCDFGYWVKNPAWNTVCAVQCHDKQC